MNIAGKQSCRRLLFYRKGENMKIKFKCQSYKNRMAIISALAGEGYVIKIEEIIEAWTENKDYFIIVDGDIECIDKQNTD
jgi:hypothetical protein